MTRKVPVPLTRCLFAPLVSIPTPWQSLPSSLEYDVFQTSLYFGWRQSWIYCSDYPVSLSKTGIIVCSSGLGVHHKLRSFAGYFLCAASTSWTFKAFWVVQYLVQWSTGCSVTVTGSNWFGSDWELRRWAIGWWLTGMYSVEMVCTLVAGGVPGIAVVTLGDQCLCVDRAQCGRSVMDIGAFLSPA